MVLYCETYFNSDKEILNGFLFCFVEINDKWYKQNKYRLGRSQKNIIQVAPGILSPRCQMSETARSAYVLCNLLTRKHLCSVDGRHYHFLVIWPDIGLRYFKLWWKVISQDRKALYKWRRETMQTLFSWLRISYPCSINYEDLRFILKIFLQTLSRPVSNLWVLEQNENVTS